MDDIDEVLLCWYAWSESYRPALGYGKASASCREYRSSRQWADHDDLHAAVERNAAESTGKAVEPLVMALDRRYRVAINNAMRNFMCERRVWDEDGYTEAKALLAGKLAVAALISREAAVN